MATRLYIVIPWFNEKAVVNGIVPRFRETLADLVAAGKVDDDSRLLFVDDGSDDGTRGLLEKWAKGNDDIELLALPRNLGQQPALIHGMRYAREHGADVVVTLDCDGQDDPCAIVKMVDAFRSGVRVVYGVRDDRTSDGFFERTAASLFYRIIRSLGSKALYNHAEFRLMSAEAVDKVVSGWRDGMFLRAYIPTLGFRSSTVGYRRMARTAGRSHYGIRKLLWLSLRAMTETIRTCQSSERS